MNFKDKYIKYKKKYLDLKNQIANGTTQNDNIILTFKVVYGEFKGFKYVKDTGYKSDDMLDAYWNLGDIFDNNYKSELLEELKEFYLKQNNKQEIEIYNFFENSYDLDFVHAAKSYKTNVIDFYETIYDRINKKMRIDPIIIVPKLKPNLIKWTFNFSNVFIKKHLPFDLFIEKNSENFDYVNLSLLLKFQLSTKKIVGKDTEFEVYHKNTNRNIIEIPSNEILPTNSQFEIRPVLNMKTGPFDPLEKEVIYV